MRGGSRRPLLLAAFCWLLFGVVLAVAYWLPVARWADGWAVSGFLKLQRPWLSDLATHVAHLANPLPFAAATVCLAVVALYRRRPRHALAVIVLLVGANLLTQALKQLLADERWHGFLGHAQIAAASFPSGHATASMSLALAALLVAPASWRPAVAVIGAIFALAVSESVMLLAWHFPSDVVGGFLVATASTLMIVSALRAAEERWPEHSGRSAAKRAISAIDVGRVAAIAGGAVACVLLVGIAAAGQRTLHFADEHTTAVMAAVVVAAMAALLPAVVAVLGARRP